MGAYNVITAASMVAGQPEDVSVVLANFNAIATVLNGGIDNSNINAAAAILASKLAGYPADAAKALKGDGTWGSVFSPNQVSVNAIPATVNGVGLVVPFAAEDFDTANMHDNVTNNTRLKAVAAGNYLIWASINWFNTITGTYRDCVVTKNGAGVAFGGTQLFGSGLVAASSAVNWTMSPARVVALALNDYVELSIVADGAAYNPTVSFGMVQVG